MGGLKFIDGDGDVTEKEFEETEKILGVRFPELLKNLVQHCDRGYPERSDIIFFDNGIDAVGGSGIGAFLAFRSDYPYEGETMIGAYKRHEDDEFFPEDLIAFALDGGGNYFCFDYRGGRENMDPPVVFWQHEAAGRPEAITPLAPNFEAFLGMLKTEEEAEAEFQEMKKKYETAEL